MPTWRSTTGDGSRPRPSPWRISRRQKGALDCPLGLSLRLNRLADKIPAMGLGPTRRDVLKGGAAVLGAGVAQGLFSDSLLHAMTAEAACGQLTDIEHVVIFINENRSFDHYFGTYPTVRGFAAPTALPAVFA